MIARSLIVLLFFTTTACADRDAISEATHPLVEAARKQIGVTVTYDPAYVSLDYPGGDVPKETGVCTDVVVRAYREFGYDLQKEVHEDMRANFSKYPKRWGLKRPDKNIDHRRVPNLETYFTRKGAKQEVSKKAKDYQPGDLVVWDLNKRGLLHIGIVSTRKTKEGTPKVIHNIGRGAVEEDILFNFKILAKYRFAPPEMKKKDSAGEEPPRKAARAIAR